MNQARLRRLQITQRGLGGILRRADFLLGVLPLGTPSISSTTSSISRSSCSMN
jgi:hypothetical protein